MMMSFLSSIGTLMSGPGFSDALELCYGPNAVQHMMDGKHVSRALRWHFLAEPDYSQCRSDTTSTVVKAPLALHQVQNCEE